MIDAKSFADGQGISFETTDEGVVLHVGAVTDTINYIVELRTR